MQKFEFHEKFLLVHSRDLEASVGAMNFKNFGKNFIQYLTAISDLDLI